MGLTLYADMVSMCQMKGSMIIMSRGWLTCSGDAESAAALKAPPPAHTGNTWCNTIIGAHCGAMLA
jgi:hypothetical protein